MNFDTHDIRIFNKEKIGNLFIFLSSNIDNLFITKLLKLTYIIDELSVKETGAPVTWLNYKVWKKGPVPQKVYYNLTFEGGEEFSDYINVKSSKRINGLKITPKGEFDDSEFSDYEIELLNRVIKDFGKLNSTQLVDFLHEEDSLWHKVVEERNLAPIFESEEDANTSPYDIVLKEAITDPFMVKMFDEMSDNIAFRERLEA